jgi:CBS domain-containing protein
MRVEEAMTRGARVIGPGVTILEAAGVMRTENVGALPVGENGALVGVVTDRDIVMRGVAEGGAPRNTTVQQVMSGNVYYCFADDDIKEAARIMAEHQVRRLPVLDRDDHLVGMLALADLGRLVGEAGKNALEGISQPNDKPRR